MPHSIAKSFVSRPEAEDSAVAQRGEATTTRMIGKWNQPRRSGSHRCKNLVYRSRGGTTSMLLSICPTLPRW
jgi:hypothetical protein